jgi:hypothetical protein
MRSLQVGYFALGLLIVAVALWPWTPAHAAQIRADLQHAARGH